MEVLREFHEGIIALSACLAGEVPRYIQKGLIDEAKKCQILFPPDICLQSAAHSLPPPMHRGKGLSFPLRFGKGNFFLELQDHGIPTQRMVNTALLTMSKELDIPLVATKLFSNNKKQCSLPPIHAPARPQCHFPYRN
mgnify:CR=1 FL=1